MSIEIADISLNNAATYLTIITILSAGIKWLYHKIFYQYEKEISYYYKSKELIDLIGNHQHLNSDLKIFWKDKKIDNTNIVITEYTLFNSGRKELRCDDIAQLMIKSKDKNTQFLDTLVHNESDDTNEFSIKEIHDDFILVDFNYINPNEFAKIRIWHTGKSEQIETKFKIKGKHCIRDIGEKYRSKYVDEVKLLKYYFISIGVAFFIKALIDKLGYFSLFWGQLLSLITLLALFGYWMWLYWFLFKNGFFEIKARVPRELRKDYYSNDL